MNRERIWSHQLRNLFHSLLLLGGMVLLLAWVGGVFFDSVGVTLAIVAVAALWTIGRVSPRWVLKMQRARPLQQGEAPDLHRVVHELARRAGLRWAPGLYLVPSRTTNAFAVGNGEEAAIGVTHGLLSTLDHREIAGVLAHEISHIRNRDLWVMGLARLMGRMTRTLSIFGQLMLLLAFPAVIMGGYQVPWLPVLLLISAPVLSSLLQLALARTREFEADLSAARLTGDPLGLASALHKLEARQGGWWRLFFPVRRRQESSLLDSHPATAERVARLRSLVDRAPSDRARVDRARDRSNRTRIPVRVVEREPRPAPVVRPRRVVRPRPVSAPRVVRVPRWILG